MSFLTQALNAVSTFQSVMSLISSSSASDVVKIMDENGNQLFTAARAMRCSVNPDSNIFEHPLEDGSTIADFAIDLPVVIQLAAVLPLDGYESTYQQLLDAKRDKTVLLVQTRTHTHENMVIKSMPHEESPEMGDCVAITLTLREVQWYTPTIDTLPAKEVSAKPAGKKTQGKSNVKSDASTVKGGQKNTTDAKSGTVKRSQSILKGWGL